MKIIIDARMYGLEHAGIGRYVMNLVSQIEKLDRENDYLILLRKKYFHDLKFKNKKFKKVLADYPHYSFAEQIKMPLQLIRLKPNLVHFPHFNVPIFWKGKFVVTIHDLIKHESKGQKTTTRWQPFYWLKYWVYKLVVWLAVKRATKIIVPCRWWKKELIRRYNLDKKKIVVTYEGIDRGFKLSTANNRAVAKAAMARRRQLSTRVLSKYSVKKPFIIYTGSLYPHKNVERLVEAAGHLRLQLVIVCARSVFYQRFMKKIGQMKAKRFVNFVGFVPDDELAILYHQAKAFVLPSLLEGFGLIGLEAMAAGLPVICSDISVLKEVYGQAVLYFNPKNVKDMAKKIEQIIADQKLREKLKKLGSAQAKKYSWQKMTEETLRVYCSLLE